MWIPAFAGMTEYFPDFARFDSLPPSAALISLRTTEQQCLVAHDIHLMINKLVLKVCEVWTLCNTLWQHSLATRFGNTLCNTLCNDLYNNLYNNEST